MRKVLPVVMLLLLSGCSSAPPLSQLADGPCTTVQKNLVTDHIAGQVDAIADKDWTVAYSFAAPSFQETVDFDLFTQIISQQYSFLITNEGYDFGSCKIKNSQLVQELTVLESSGNFLMSYLLTVEDQKLGVFSAELTELSTDTPAIITDSAPVNRQTESQNAQDRKG